MKKRRPSQREITKLTKLVGQFIIAFGAIEDATHWILRDIPIDSVHNTAARLPFQRRVELIIEIIEHRSDISSQDRTEVKQLLKRSVVLSEMRNVLAHSPLMMSIYSHPNEAVSMVTTSVGSVRNKDKLISTKDIEEVLPEVKQIGSDLYKLFSSMWHQVFDNKKP